MKVFLLLVCVILCSIGVVECSECFVSLNTSKVVNVIEKFYLSYCIDSGILANNYHWINFDFSSPKLHTLLSEMSPSILRIGGGPADALFFDIPYPLLNATNLQPSPVVLKKKDLLNLLRLTRDTNNILLFDLNVQLRYGYQWDPSQAIRLMQFCKEHSEGARVAFELGNEPDWLLPSLITPERLAEDFVTLHKLLHSYKEDFLFMLGPDVVSTDGVGGQFLKSVVDKAGQYLKAATFHHYYFRGDTATHKDYLNPNILSSLSSTIHNVHAVIRSTHNPDTAMWLGETSDAWHEGTPNVSDRFVSSFLWLDKLGLSALLGVDVVMRQTLYGLNYALLDPFMDPTPDYWLSWLFKRFVGDRVLKVDSACEISSAGKGTASEELCTFRMYAHCTRPSAEYKEGAVAMFGLNMGEQGAVVNFKGDLSNKWMHVFFVQPGEVASHGDGGGSEGGGDEKDFHFYNKNREDLNGFEDMGSNGNRRAGGGYGKFQRFVKEISLLSKHVMVNGKLMKMPSDNTMPTTKPLHHYSSNPLLIPNFSYAFIVLPEFNLDLCLT